MCGGGGGGGSGEQRYNWNSTLEPYWNQALGMGNYLTGLGLNGASGQQYQPYPGQRIAGLNTDQYNAMANTRNIAQAGPFNNAGAMDTNAAREQARATASGEYLGANPTTRNVYAGPSSYFDSVLQTGMGDIAEKYKQGTAADTTRMFNLAGAFGGSAHQQKMANNESGLAKQLGDYSQSMLNDQYNRSAGLEESYLGRESQNFENERNRMMGALAPGQQGQQLDFQRYNQLMGIGDIQRGLSQDYLNQGYSDWQEQKNYPFQMLDYMTGLMGRAQGGVSPNMQMTQPGYSASPFSQILGAGLLGYGAFGPRST